VTVVYLDTSAAMKLLVAEPESAALRKLLTASSRVLVSSWLMHAELNCAIGRRGDGIDPAFVAAVLESVFLVDVTRGDLLAAPMRGHLRTNDAIHLATALRCGEDEMITYDAELARAADAAGLHVLTPA